MILSDNETKIDLLNNEAIAQTVLALIKESNDQPISIGIHGDWGAGKSSILEMIENAIDSEVDGKRYSCIRFNGWRHQGFEDSKIALMSSIISELNKKEKLGAKSEKILKKLWKNINWMNIAKTAGKTAIGIATGTAPITILSSAFDLLKNATTTKDGIDAAIDAIGGYLEESKITEDTSSNREFTEFQENFSELLDDAKIDKLVVLIDDLDRCLPDVTISTLEAVRLFMFTEKTAFVIAADESMIRYAVKKHFPDVINENKINAGDTFADKYLEKLIQVPFRIPALGEVEACIYIMLLMVGSALPENNAQYVELCKEGLSRIQKPWNVECFTVEDVRTILKDDYTECADEVLIATQICHLLAENTDGNPRKIKRFLNMLLLRYKIAQNRGFGEELELTVLAKMMLAEYYIPAFYKKLPEHLDKDGKWKEVSEILVNIENSIEKEKVIDNQECWYDLNEIGKWITSEPSITDKDLRPYYYACKEKIDYFSGISDENDLSEIVDLLFSDEMIIAGEIDTLKSLTNQKAEMIFDVVAQKIIETGKFDTKPKGVDGLFILVQNKTDLREKLVNFVDTIPTDKVGVWVTTGWDRALPKKCEERKLLDQYLDKLKNSGSTTMRNALKNIKEN